MPASAILKDQEVINEKYYEFSDDNFLGINLFLFSGATLALIFANNYKTLESVIFAVIMILFVVLRIFVKPRPPEAIAINLLTREITISNRRKPFTEKISFDEIKSADCFVRPARFPMAELTIALKDNSRRQYYFASELKGKSFFKLKDVPSDQLVEVVRVINEIKKSS